MSSIVMSLPVLGRFPSDGDMINHHLPLAKGHHGPNRNIEWGVESRLQKTRALYLKVSEMERN